MLKDNTWIQEENKNVVDVKEGRTLPSETVSSRAGSSGGVDTSSDHGASGGAEGSRSAGGSGRAYNSRGPGSSGGAELSRFAGGSGGSNRTPESSRPESSRPIQFQGDRGNLQGPMVSQPGRSLPDLPKHEEVPSTQETD